MILSVHDTGIGMDDEHINMLLNDSYASRKGTRQEKGLGIGLRLCREVLKKLNGKIEIESKPQAGTIVKMILPGMRP